MKKSENIIKINLRPNVIDVKSCDNLGDKMKKIVLVCVTALMGVTLTACGNSSSQKSARSNNSSNKTTKAVKHHKHKIKKQVSSSITTSSSSTTQPQEASNTSTSSNNAQINSNSQPEAWSSQQQARNQAAQNDSPTSEDQARAMLGGANGDLQATRTSNGWAFSGDGYTATVGDDGSISHN